MLIVGDPHIKITNIDAGRQFITWLKETVRSTRPGWVVFLGDFFDSHAVIRAEILSDYRNLIDFLMVEQRCNVAHVLGNHEQYVPTDSTYHALQSMKNLYPNYHVIDTRTDIDNMTFIPFLADHTQFPKDTKEICFAHQSFIGVDFGGFRPEYGVNADEVAAEIIISGHIHRQQEFGKVWYPGSPFAQTANDVDQVKGIFRFDLETYAKTFIECPLPRWRSVDMELNAEVSVDSALEVVSATINSDDHWVLKVKGARADVTALLESPTLKKLKKAYQIQERTSFTDLAKERVKIEASSADTLIDEYLDKVYDGLVDKVELKKTIAGFLAETKG